MARTIKVNILTTSPLILAILTRQPGVGMKKVHEAVKEAFRSCAYYWQRNFLPKHFQGDGARYGYAQRKMQYRMAKLKRWGHDDALEWSGRSRRLATNMIAFEGRLRITSTSSRVSAKVIVPTTEALRRNVRYGYPLTRELVAHNAEEDKILEQVFWRKINELLFGVKTSMPSQVA